MSSILAGIDNSAAAGPVLAVARAVAPLVGASVRAVHVREDGHRTADAVAAAAHIDLTERDGEHDPIEILSEEGALDDVSAVVLGLRGLPTGARPAGHVARALATTLDKPVVLVPPDPWVPTTIRRVLVPLQGDPGTAHSLRNTIATVTDAGLELVVLHVHDPAALPPFRDQPAHEDEAWARTFLERYCRVHAGDRVRLIERVGPVAATILQVSDEIDADLLALGWDRDLSPGHGEIVRTVLERSRKPVLLLAVA